IKAQLMVALGPLVTMLPVVKAVAISLMKAPEVDFDITLTKGETHVLNLVKPWLRSTIAAAFAPYVLPERVGIPMEPGAPDSQKPEGILQ
ncbi:SMP-LTD domain-containing protein, partial [Haematococcus lacustris]